MRDSIKRIVNCILGSLVTTMIILVLSFLFMVFSSGEDGMRTTFFGALYFNPVTNSEGVLGIHFGITENYMPILLAFIIVFIFYFCVSTSYKVLVNYRKKLIQENKLNEK